MYPPELSDEVNKMKCTWTSDMSSHFQMKCTLRSDIPPRVVRWSEQDEVHMDIRYEFTFSDEVHTEIRYTPQLSDEVNKMKCTWTSDMSSYFQMKCTDSDIPPKLSDEMNKMKCKWISRYEFIFSDEVHRFRYMPLVVVRWSEQLGQLVRWSAHRHQIYVSWNVDNISYPYKEMNLNLTYSRNLGEHCPKTNIWHKSDC